MWRQILIFCIFGAFVESLLIENPGPRYPPTKGEIWPSPQIQVKEISFFTVSPILFKYKITSYTCLLLTKAITRYSNVLQRSHELTNVGHRSRRGRSKRRHLRKEQNSRNSTQNEQGYLRTLQVELTEPCEDLPHFEMDESYNLTISSESKLTSASIWGIMRGLESFSQLIYITDDFTELRINRTEIQDFPNYKHRGLLIDTARHFISLNNILNTIDAMAMNKMNVLHWHIVDDQSFPYQSKKFPDLSKGAYHPTMVYTRADIRMVVNFAIERGIRVIPEFDVPGHTRSWGVAYPSLLTQCYQDGSVVGLGPMNPINNATYKLLRDLFEEVHEWFPDQFLHVGGDEVDQSCWRSNPELQDYMKAHNMTRTAELHALFIRNTIPVLGETTPIVWQEVFDERVPLSNNTLVHVWKGGKSEQIQELTAILTAGHRVLYSTDWYLDHFDFYGTWRMFYQTDPRAMLRGFVAADLMQNIVGGEACMWGESVDDRNIITRVWPRASAIAASLWSGPKDTNNDVNNRIEEHTCRMIRRGVPAQPANSPGFCITSHDRGRLRTNLGH